ncbi:MAG: MFS transporter, partial [Bacteroidales bacterium]
ALTGSLLSGVVIEKFFVTNGEIMWHQTWLSFAIYSLIVTIAFAIFFKHKHNPADFENVHV